MTRILALALALLLALTACGARATHEKLRSDPQVRVVGVVSAPGAGMTPELRRKVAALERRYRLPAHSRLVSRVVHVGCLSARVQDVHLTGSARGPVTVSADVHDANLDCITALASAAVIMVPDGTPVRVAGR
ncbi:hypothetical protein [Nocardioides montaniterrae]